MATKLESSYIELRKSMSYTPRNFYLTRNIPLDVRFLVESLDTLNNEIPKEIRYPGLTFFVRDSNVNDGTTKQLDGTKNLGSTEFGTEKIFGILYCFDDNLEPIPLHDLVNRFEIRLLKFDDTSDDCYKLLTDKSENSNETNSLNHIFAKIGNIVFIEPLGIAVICRLINNEIVWKYFAGTYNVKSEEQFNNIPDELKQTNITVNVDGTNKIILSDLTLSDEIITANSTSDCDQDRRFYNINGFIYYRFGGLVIPVSNKFTIKNVSLKVGDNIIDLSNENSGDNNSLTIFDTDFNTENIIVDCILEYKNEKYRFPIEQKIIDSNTINIVSSIAVENVTLIIRANS